MVAALIRPHPLSSLDERVLELPAGYSVADIARMVWPDARTHPFVAAFIGDVRVPVSEWERVRPKPGALVRLGLTCFQGGGGDKQVLAIVATIAIAMFAPYAATSLMGLQGAAAAAVQAGITIAGALLIGALFKPPRLSVGGPSSSPQEAQTYTITGQQNQATPYGPMLRVYGRHRIFPRLAAVPYTVTEGPNQYLYMLLDCGYGPLQIENLQIGDTPFLNYAEVLWRVHERWQAGDALEIYLNDTSYDTFSVRLLQDVENIRVSAEDASGLVLDFQCPRGIVSFDDRGNRTPWFVTLGVWIRPAGSGGAWEAVRSYPVHVSRESGSSLNVQPVIAAGPSEHFDEYDRHFFAEGTTSFSVQCAPGESVHAGDILYFASQTMHTITSAVAIPPPASPDQFQIVIDPPLAQAYPGERAECPIIRDDQEVVIEDSTSVPVLFSLTIDVPAGQWEVRVMRDSEESDSDRIFDQCNWVSLRSIADRPPLAVRTDHTIIELKIRASDQLSGVLANVNCIATSILPVWDGAEWTEEATRNPAWAYADVLRGPASMRPLPDSRLDLDRLMAWADYCDELVPNGVDDEPEERVRFDHVVDYATTTFQLLQSIAAAGRATPAVRDGKHGAIADEEQTLPVQLFTPRNSWGFRARRSYLTEPHALRVKFIDPNNNWQEGEVQIFAAGYGPDTATTFEDLKLFGVTRYTQATRDGRYLKAQALLRREEFEIQCDIENLIAERGDLVLVQHDVLEVGGESSRVLSVAGDRITLADPFGALADERYGVRLRLSDGTITDPIEAHAEPPATFQLATVPTPAPAAGDLLAWGLLNTETGEYLVKQVAPGDDLTALLTLAEIARGVYTADSGSIPAYEPPAGGRLIAGPGPIVENLQVEQRDKTVAREPYCDLVLSWLPPTLGGYQKYRVYRIDAGGVNVQLAETNATSVQVETNLRLLDPGADAERVYAVVGVDAIGKQSLSATATYTPVDPRWIPDDVQYLSSNVHDKMTMLTWIPPTDPANPGNGQVQYYELRWTPDTVSWGNSSRVTELVPWNVTTVTVPSRNGAYLIKAITGSGMESDAPAVTATAVEQLVIQDFWTSIRFEPTWAGTLDNVLVQAGSLILAEQGDGTYPNVGVFYPSTRQVFDEIVQCRLSATLTAAGNNSTDVMAGWIPLALAAPLASARRGVDWDASVWVSASDSLPFPMSEWVPLAIADPIDPIPTFDEGTWRPLIHGEYIGRTFRFAVVLQSMKPTVSPLVEIAGVDIDFPERSEQHSDVTVTAAGLDFTFDRPFAFAPSVAIALQDAAAGDYVERGAVGQAGFNVFVRNAAGAAIAGSIDVMAFGVGRVL